MSDNAAVRRRRRRRWGPLAQVGYALGLPVLLILLWWWRTTSAPNFFYPTPPQLWHTFWDTWASSRFSQDFLPSIGRLALGIVATIVLGVLLGVLIGSFRWLRVLTEPVLEFFRAVPPPVLVPVLMLLIGINTQMRVIVIISGAIWPVLLNTVEGVRAVDQVLSDTARTYRIGGFARYRYLVLPGAGPQIMAGIRQCLSISLILMVISEMFGSSSGLGFTIVLFQRTFAVAQMWSGIVVLGLIGFALSVIFQIVERRVLRWYFGQREVQREQ
jgi:ABC-type nitrate/sulfonate/bicarbonate transport system permease component